MSLPTDVVRCGVAVPGPFPAARAAQRRRHFYEALEEAVAMLKSAALPIIVADVELIRFGLQGSSPHFLARTGLPYATMMLGKTVLDESHPQFIGLYQGDRSRDYARHRIENADCVFSSAC